MKVILLENLKKWFNFNFEIIDYSPGDEAGIKSVVIRIEGENAYGLLQSEKGAHRLVRISPFDTGNRRHTSFSLVEVMPELENDEEIKIDNKDLRIDVFKAGGAGGQSVQKNSTAVRITHIPSKISVSVQNERSQLQNKMQAMEILKSKLWDLELRKQQEEISKARKSQVGSGERSEKIRTYNYPQGRITDHRINVSIHSLSEFMDGLIDNLIEPLMKNEQAQKMLSQNTK